MQLLPEVFSRCLHDLPNSAGGVQQAGLQQQRREVIVLVHRVDRPLDQAQKGPDVKAFAGHDRAEVRVRDRDDRQQAKRRRQQKRRRPQPQPKRGPPTPRPVRMPALSPTPRRVLAAVLGGLEELREEERGGEHAERHARGAPEREGDRRGDWRLGGEPVDTLGDGGVEGRERLNCRLQRLLVVTPGLLGPDGEGLGREGGVEGGDVARGGERGRAQQQLLLQVVAHSATRAGDRQPGHEVAARGVGVPVIQHRALSDGVRAVRSRGAERAPVPRAVGDVRGVSIIRCAEAVRIPNLPQLILGPPAPACAFPQHPPPPAHGNQGSVPSERLLLPLPLLLRSLRRSARPPRRMCGVQLWLTPALRSALGAALHQACQLSGRFHHAPCCPLHLPQRVADRVQLLQVPALGSREPVCLCHCPAQRFDCHVVQLARHARAPPHTLQQRLRVAQQAVHRDQTHQRRAQHHEGGDKEEGSEQSATFTAISRFSVPAVFQRVLPTTPPAPLDAHDEKSKEEKHRPDSAYDDE
mmetsp:Transcript_59865/g.140969  ORF Transcript_59865/g.140969 Transcript_59865/m.140969 type:complete len:525 (-) Transcript_59865:524-2098(-)